MFLYGANGIGKTEFVKHQLSSLYSNGNKFDETSLSLGYGYIDCVYSKSESEISKYLYRSLISKILLAGDEVPNNFLSLIRSVKHHVVRRKIRYFVFDNVDRITHRGLFRKIMGVRKVLKDYVRIVMICNGCIPKLSFFDEFLATEETFFPIFMPPPSKENLKRIISNKMKEPINEQANSLFIDLIYTEYSQYTTQINYYFYLYKTFIPLLFRDIENIKEDDIQKIYNRRFRHIGKWFIVNLFVPINEDIDIEKAYYKDNNDMMCNECFSYAESAKFGLNYLEAVLLVAVYISSHNPFQVDRKLFLRTRKKRKALKRVILTAKKVEMRRVVSLADYFLSTIDNSSFEYHRKGHSIGFYGQLNNLIERGYVKKHVKKATQEIYYTSQIDYTLIEEIANSIDIPLFEYLYNDNN